MLFTNIINTPPEPTGKVSMESSKEQKYCNTFLSISILDSSSKLSGILDGGPFPGGMIIITYRVPSVVINNVIDLCN